MASVIWMSVFAFLCVELVIVALLVLPLPRGIRKWMARTIRKLNLGPRVRFAAQWIMFMLVAAVVESVTTMRRLESREEAPVGEHGSNAYDPRGGYVEMNIGKQRKFRAERNMYLASFALTLLFVIARIVELMQENVSFEDERDAAKKQLSELAEAANTTMIPPSGSQQSGLRQRVVVSDKSD